jgi:hypothetical protein
LIAKATHHVKAVFLAELQIKHDQVDLLRADDTCRGGAVRDGANF